MGRLLEQILGAELTDEASSRAMIGILNRQLYASRLPQRVRWQGVGVAHKTGDWPPIAGNDVGILFYEGGPSIISVFTNQNTGDFFVLEATLGLIAEDIVRVLEVALRAQLVRAAGVAPVTDIGIAGIDGVDVGGRMHAELTSGGRHCRRTRRAES
jgi:hypothetical protein